MLIPSYPERHDRNVCQVCGVRLKFFSEEDRNAKLEEWAVFSWRHPEGDLHVMVCPHCARYDQYRVLSGYQARILTGFDVNYH